MTTMDAEDISDAAGDHEAEANTSANELGMELRSADPRDLLIGTNVRSEASLTPNFVRNLQRRGVRSPIPVRKVDADGTLMIINGQRRTLGAIKAGLARVPVLVLPYDTHDSDLDDKLAKIERIFDQLGENEQRAALTEHDELAATQQLLDLGLSVREIAYQRSISRKRVTTTAKVANSRAATDAVTDTGLDLVQASVIAEFEGDEEATAELRETATHQPQLLEHVAQRWRDKRAEQTALAAKAEEFTAAGITVVDLPVFGQDTLRRLTSLRPSPGEAPGTELTADAHAACPGRAVALRYRPSSNQDEAVQAVEVCTDFHEHGHAELWASAGAITQLSSPENRSNGGRMTEADKKYRKKVIANGKAWDSASKLRREWLRTFATRKTAPKDAAAWTAQIWATADHCLRKALDDRHELAVGLLGLPEHDSVATAAANATAPRATVISTVLALAAIEAETSRRRTWEAPTKIERSYFAQIQQWGYKPSEVEALVTATADDQDNGAETPDKSDQKAGQDFEAPEEFSPPPTETTD